MSRLKSCLTKKGKESIKSKKLDLNVYINKFFFFFWKPGLHKKKLTSKFTLDVTGLKENRLIFEFVSYFPNVHDFTTGSYTQ